MKRKKDLFKSIIVLSVTAATILSETPVDASAYNDFASTQTALFQDVEMKYRPYARWWLAEGSHTDTTLKESVKELYDAGYGGVEFVTLTSEAEYLDDETYGWGSDEWVHDTKTIISECAKYGMSVSMTGGTYWATANLPKNVITPDSQEASQELGYKAVELKGVSGTNTSFKGKLPQCVLPGDSTTQSLVTVVAAKVVSWAPVPDENSEETAENVEKTKIDTNTLTVVKDLTTVNDDGTYSIDFTAEDDGDYILFAFYEYGTSESYAASVTNVNYTINYLDPVGANALIKYWDEKVLTPDVKNLLDEIDECSLYMDSLDLSTKGEDSTKQLWCQNMLTEFKNRRSYDLEKYLPLLIRETADGVPGKSKYLTYIYDNTESEDINVDMLRTDYFQTETELYQENTLTPVSEWLHENGMTLRAENSYGKTLELSQTVSSVDYLETESFLSGNEIDWYRNFSGPAHIYEKRLSSETGAALNKNYFWNNGYYRQIFYSQYASGIQKTITHGYSSEYGPEQVVSWPGYEGMTKVISERFNKRQPGFLDSQDVNAQMSRIQKVLEQGVPQVDIAMLHTDYYMRIMTDVSSTGIDTNRMHNQDAYYWRDLKLQNAGYTYDYFSPYCLEDDVLSVSNGVMNASGVAYKALVVMENELPFTAAQKLLSFAEAGLPVLFVNNVVEDMNKDNIYRVNTIAGSTTGCNDGKDEELADIVNQIKALPNVKTIDSTDEAQDALLELGVTPRVGYAEPNDKILTVLRKASDATYLYVYNYMFNDTEDYSGQINIEGNYQAYEMDTWTGNVEKYDAAQSADDITSLNVEIAPGDVEVFVLDPSGSSEYSEAMKNDYRKELKDWNLTVDSYTPGELVSRTETTEETNVTTTEVTISTNHEKIEVGTLSELVPWKDISSVGEAVSGAGMYTNSFILPTDWNSETDTLIFKADSFNFGTAMIMVNGEKVPVNMNAAEADLSDFVIPGENTISVRVTSSLRNAARVYPEIEWLNEETPVDDYGMTGNTELLSNRLI